MNGTQDLLPDAIHDARNAWSMGTFGAIAEFMRNADEPVAGNRRGRFAQQVTARGGIGVDAAIAAVGVMPIAYDLLSSDGQTWSHALTFCLPRRGGETSGLVRCIGPDHEALQAAHCAEWLFDLGVGAGLVDFCVRTNDPALVSALRALEGNPLTSPAAAAARRRMAQISPHRVVRSPLGRIEVYAPIPPSDGRSPNGPHTHLLPKLLSARRTHGANVPIPDGLQPVLTLHPRSPWHDSDGARAAFDSQLNEEFDALFARYALPEDKEIRIATEVAVLGNADPAAYGWPGTRRGRAQARITLRRLAQRLGPERVRNWRLLYDHASSEEDATPAANGSLASG